MSGDDRDPDRGPASGPGAPSSGGREPGGSGGNDAGQDFDSRLRDARARLDASRGRRKDGAEPETKAQALGYALRVGTELVAATLVGVGIGWLLDWWLGTAPWLMILFLFAGGAAGVLNVYRLVAGEDQAIGWRRPGAATPKTDEPAARDDPEDPDDPDRDRPGGDGSGT